MLKSSKIKNSHDEYFKKNNNNKIWYLCVEYAQILGFMWEHKKL